VNTTGSTSWRISPAERREVGLLSLRMLIGAGLAVVGLYLSKLDLGPWNVLAAPLVAFLTEGGRKFMFDTTAPAFGPVPPPGPPSPQTPLRFDPFPSPPAEPPKAS